MKKLYKVMSMSIITCMLINPVSAFALTKTESVYSNLNSDGTVKSTTVNTKLSQIEEGEVIDYTKLNDITNLNGKEKFTRDSDKITWKSTGKDIVYQGKINDELPIKVSTKYYLNDKEISVKDLKGKSGSIKIEYKLTNISYDNNSGMYTPFVVTMVNLMDSSVNTNVNVSNGKVVNNGKKNVVTAIAAPGLYDSVKIDELKDMDTIVVTYDTTKFSISDTYFVATPKLLENADISKLNEVSNLKYSLNTLQDGMNKLEDGSNTLNDGASKLNDGAKELNKGLESAYNGSTTLSDGASQLDNGLSELNEGIKKALDGSNAITEGLEQVNAGSQKLSSLTNLVDKLYATYNENNELLNNIMSGTTEQQLKDGINQATIEKTNLENKLNEINTGIAALEAGETAGVLTEEQVQQLAYLRNTKPQVEAGIKQYAEGISNAQNNLNSLSLAPAKISGANEVISQVLCGILGVDSMDYVNYDSINYFKGQINNLLGGINQLSDGSKNLSVGLDKIYQGSNKLSEGSKKLAGGTEELNEGILKLYNGSKDLSEGTEKLNNGSIELHDGICRINKEGINKLSSYGNEVSNYTYKIEKLVELSKNYKGFSSNNSDEVIFVYKLS